MSDTPGDDLAVETPEFENPVRFEYREGMTPQKLADPLFERERTRISRALLFALAGTVFWLPLSYFSIVNGGVAAGVVTLSVEMWLWARAGRRANSLRRTTSVVMDESYADRQDVWSTHRANRVVRGRSRE